LRTLAEQEGYSTFVIPDDVGGRFSVFTPVGLLPIAVAGFDIDALIKGAVDMASLTAKKEHTNPAVQYAAVRNALYAQGRKIEVLVNYNPKLHYVTEWWKQLYGESEGKAHKGLFPAGVDFTSDLHSMGQYLQEGERHLFETVLSVAHEKHMLTIPHDAQNLDQLNFLAGKRLCECNKMAELGTLLAHVDGGVPNVRLEIPALDEYHLGGLLYFFEKACGISGYLLGVNPFDQPGVEAYKKNMFALLHKPGFEQQGEALRKRI
jgi:glucose-6-phosphate isomerase